MLLDDPRRGQRKKSVKIVGSAQRRRRGSVLQHGSVLLGSSSAAPELPGIAEVSGVSLRADELAQTWLPHLARELQLDMQPAKLPDSVVAAAATLEREKYSADGWLRRR